MLRPTPEKGKRPRKSTGATPAESGERSETGRNGAENDRAGWNCHRTLAFERECSCLTVPFMAFG